MSSSPLVDITDREIDPREVEKAVWTSADGAMVTFSGVVRDHDGGREVHDIEYSAHPTARDTLARLCDEVAAEHTSAADSGRTVRVSAVHRVGVLPVGEVAACSELIERLKHGVPIWKRQRFTDGVSEWVGVGDC